MRIVPVAGVGHRFGRLMLDVGPFFGCLRMIVILGSAACRKQEQQDRQAEKKLLHYLPSSNAPAMRGGAIDRHGVQDARSSVTRG
jgi:hypothetical protein